MRQRFERPLDLGQTPIEQVPIPPKSRDELPPVLRGLQWIFQTPEINEQIFQLLEQRVTGGKQATGRPGMDLWHVLVLGVVRLALDCDYDRLEYLVHYDTLLRRIMGLESHFRGEFGQGFHQKTLRENVCHVDEALLAQINEIVVKAGRVVFKKKDDEPLRAKSDTYVLETNVHFPTDLNLLWDACRKCLDVLPRLARSHDLPGWRKTAIWRAQLKTLLRVCGAIHHGGGAKKPERLEAAVKAYLQKAYALEQKVFTSLRELRAQPVSLVEQGTFVEVEYFHEKLIKHLDLIERRVLKGETIPHAEKDFSLFEPHTEWISKGKVSAPVELGHKVLITTDQYSLILDYKVMDQSSDVKETLPLADRLLARFGDGSLQSWSVDKGFSAQQDRELLELFIPEVIMPKKGRRSQADQARETHPTFQRLRRQHSAIESNINALEHHGLNRCPDKGLSGFQRYVGLGILAYNLHKIGHRLLAYNRQRQPRLKHAA
ncbi:MAG: ISNCY family transposase [Desulfatiglandales bacterium]